jgi:hypothetical protein
MLPEKIDNEIQANFLLENFRLKTQQQISKDFGVHGFNFSPSFSEEAYSLEALVDTVSEAMMYLIEKQSTSWHPLLYTMDIPEQTYLKLATSNDYNWMEQFTCIVIRREALKVFLREKYS